jgi:hypothetical protein
VCIGIGGDLFRGAASSGVTAPRKEQAKRHANDSW